MKRTLVLMILAGTLIVGLLAGPALSSPPWGEEPPPPHGHLMLTGVEYDSDGEPVDYKKCRELANGKPVPKHAHHEHRHVGGAGEQSGNIVVPLAPLAPWENCAEFRHMIFGEE